MRTAAILSLLALFFAVIPGACAQDRADLIVGKNDKWITKAYSDWVADKLVQVDDPEHPPKLRFEWAVVVHEAFVSFDDRLKSAEETRDKAVSDPTERSDQFELLWAQLAGLSEVSRHSSSIDRMADILKPELRSLGVDVSDLQKSIRGWRDRCSKIKNLHEASTSKVSLRGRNRWIAEELKKLPVEIKPGADETISRLDLAMAIADSAKKLTEKTDASALDATEHLLALSTSELWSLNVEPKTVRQTIRQLRKSG